MKFSPSVDGACTRFRVQLGNLRKIFAEEIVIDAFSNPVLPCRNMPPSPRLLFIHTLPIIVACLSTHLIRTLMRIIFSLALALAILVVRAQAIRKATEQRQAGTDDIVETYSDRLSPLKADLKSNVRHLGYDQPEEPGQPLPSSEAWIVSQYVLAPVVLTRVNLDQVTLVDCLSPTQLTKTLSREDIELVKVYDKGIVLVVPKGDVR